MKRLTTILICIMLGFSSTFLLTEVSEDTAGKAIVHNGIEYVTHAPIRIDSNADFDETHGVANWATGNGSPGNPWIIEGLDINGTGFGYCLYIGNTTNHFEVKNCYFHDVDGESGPYNYPFIDKSGFTLYNVTNGTIKDNTIESCYSSGLFILYSNEFDVHNNTANYNGWGGIYFDYCSNFTITNNTVSNSWRGIYTDYCENITISYNSIFSHNMIGLLINKSNCTTLIENNMLNDGIAIAGDELSNWNTHDIDTSNTVNGKPIIYWRNQTGGTIPPGAGEVILANCSNIIINNQNVSGGDNGIQLGFSFNNTISNNIVENNSCGGIQLYASVGNMIINNSIKNINMTGITTGINIYSSNNNTLFNNSITGVDRGIEIRYSNDNNILNNILVNNGSGISATFSDRNLIANNTMLNNIASISFERSIGTIIRNNIIDLGEIHYSWIPYGIFFIYSSESIIKNNTFNNSNILIWGDELSHWNTHYIDSSNTIHGKPVRYLCNQTGGTVPPGAGEVILANCTNVLIRNQNLSGGTVGLVLGFSNDSIVYDNTIDSNGFAGIYMDCSDNNIFYNNSICNNQKPFYIFPCVNNRIYHNNFIDNNKLPTDFGSTYWDNGYPDGGNYWSDYNGVDFNSTPTQDVPPPDGIGDSPYFLDNYPLMMPFEYEFTNHNFSLSEGWNFISLPLIQGDESIDKVLESIDGKWDYIQAYDAVDQDHWKSNMTYRPDQLNDLKKLNHKMGFWGNITQPGAVLTVSGYVPTSTSIPLYAGWNLVGYPSLSTETVANALWGTGADKVEVCDQTAPYRTREVGPMYLMKPGEGYWVHVPADTVWVVNW